MFYDKSFASSHESNLNKQSDQKQINQAWIECEDYLHVQSLQNHPYNKNK